MRVALVVLCFLIPTFAISQDTVDKLFFSNNVNLTAFQNGMERLRNRTIETLIAEQSETQKAILREYHKHPHYLNLTHVSKQGDSISEVNEKAHVADQLYQMDIIPSPKEIEELMKEESGGATRTRRQAFRGNNYPHNIWANNMVYYFFSYTMSQRVRVVIEKAIQFWKENTCIDFQYNDRAHDKIQFVNNMGCSSHIGKVGGTQIVSIGRGCESMGTAIHEIGHALGLFHTQARHDRNSFITLDINNIKSHFLGQFKLESTSTNYNYGMPYDWGSVMHYGARSASQDWDRDSIIARDQRYQNTMGSNIPAFIDVSMVNEHYSCKARCDASISARCYNGGYPHPRDCSKCQCPSGFGGTLCNERPSGCGGVYTATPISNSFSVRMGSEYNAIAFDFEKCHFMITTTPGNKIEIRITSLNTICNEGCSYGGIEIKGHTDVRMTGFRYCCYENENTVITSPGYVLALISFNRFGTTSFTLEYRSVGGVYVGNAISSQGNLNGQVGTTAASININEVKKEKKCEDNAGCRVWVTSFQFCTRYPESYRKRYCPKSCRHC